MDEDFKSWVIFGLIVLLFIAGANAFYANGKLNRIEAFGANYECKELTVRTNNQPQGPSPEGG